MVWVGPQHWHFSKSKCNQGQNLQARRVANPNFPASTDHPPAPKPDSRPLPALSTEVPSSPFHEACLGQALALRNCSSPPLPCHRALPRGGTRPSRPTGLPAVGSLKPQGCCLSRAGGHLVASSQQAPQGQEHARSHTAIPPPLPVFPCRSPGTAFRSKILTPVLQGPAQILSSLPDTFPDFLRPSPLLTPDKGKHSSTDGCRGPLHSSVLGGVYSQPF